LVCYITSHLCFLPAFVYVFFNTKQKFLLAFAVASAIFFTAAYCIYKLAFVDKPVSFFGCVAYRTTLLLLNTAVLPLPHFVV